MAAREIRDIRTARAKRDRPTPLAPEERESIVNAVRTAAGTKSLRQVARETGRNVSTVSRLAKAAGIDSNVAATEKATAARRDYGLAERLEVVNEALDKVRSLVETADRPAEMWQLSTAIKTLVEVRRLEEGEATSRMETSSADVRQKVFSRLDELGRRGS